ncbi:XrtA/PEP-CTERM system TPR-repeat protein PrsT [Colwellia sp. MEBiC06753]
MKKLTLVSTAVSIALLASGCSPSKSTQEYLMDAEQLMSQGEFNEAIIELKNGVVEAPTAPQLRGLLGKAYIEQANYIAAEKELEKAIQLGATDYLADELSFTKLKLSKYDEVFQLLDEGSSASDEEYMLLLVYAGVAATQNGNISQGQDYFSQAISINENAIYGQMAKAYLAQTKSNYIEALSIIDKLNQQHGELDEALLLKGNLQFGLEQYQEAAETFRQYVQKKPRAFYVKYFQISSLLKSGNYDAAEKEVDWLLSKVKNAPLAEQYKALIEYNKKNYQQAKQYAEQAAQAGSQFLIAKMIAGLSAYQLKDIEQAYTHLRPIEQYIGNGHPVKKVLAIVRLELGYTDAAIDTLNQLSGTDNALLLELAGDQIIGLGDIPSALKVLEKAEALAPKNAKIKAQRGILMLKEGDEAGLDILEQAVNIEGATGAEGSDKQLDTSLIRYQLVYIAALLKNNEYDRALESIEQWKASNPESVTGYNLEAQVYQKQGKLEQAAQAYKKAEQIKPNNPASLIFFANQALEDGEVQQAKNFINRLMSASPDHIIGLSTLYRILTTEGNTGVALSKLKQSYENNVNDPAYLTLYSQALYEQGQYANVVALLTSERIDDVYRQSSEFWLRLGNSYLELERSDEARNLFSDWVKQQPENTLARFRYVHLLNESKSYQTALDSITDFLTIEPNNEIFKALEINILIEQFDFEKAQTKLNELASETKESSSMQLAQGKVYYAKKMFDQAIPFLKGSYQKNPSGIAVMLLEQSYLKVGKIKEAEAVLSAYLEQFPKDNKARFLLAEVQMITAPNNAIDQYEYLLKIDADNYVILNNLATLYFDQGQYDKAFNHAEKALTLAKNNPYIMNTAGKVYIAQGKIERGLELLKLAAKLKPNDKEIVNDYQNSLKKSG